MSWLRHKLNTLAALVSIWYNKLFEAVLGLLPVRKNRIIFSSFCGKSYSCNQRAIFEYLVKHYPKKFDCIWMVDAEHPWEAPAIVRNNAKCVRYKSNRAKYYKATAGFWCMNHRNTFYLKKKKNQFYLQTWHGDIGFKVYDQSLYPADADSPYIRKCKWDAVAVDAVTIGSAWGREGIGKSYYLPEGKKETVFWPCGSPRNDVLLNRDRPESVKAVYEAFALDSDTKICLYAPTFRQGFHIDGILQGDDGAFFERICDALEERFGGHWVMCIRVHPACLRENSGIKLFDGKRILNAGDYPDMSDLLLTADALISDYSSSPFDFMLTGKPCWLFMNDRETYIKQTPLLMNMDEVLFDICLDAQSLLQAIRSFSEDNYRKNVSQMLDTFGSLEQGRACAYVAERFAERVL